MNNSRFEQQAVRRTLIFLLLYQLKTYFSIGVFSVYKTLTITRVFNVNKWNEILNKRKT